ncbi:MAG: tRNA uridine-5-carboxymethylaminomethyl(34) synthesis GTPase MnmE [Bacilli bacterium]
MNDTIAAISTALGVGAISIIRISGKKALYIVNKIFKGKNLMSVPTHTIHYGHIIDNDKIIDEVLVSVMKAPKSFTVEDIVEINCHGGIATTNKILELLLINGCRLAEPGEFTKRAFLNGRIDLLEAESVMDILKAKTEKTREIGINQLSGQVSEMIRNLRQKILEILANIEVNIDYPEYEDIEELTLNIINPKIIDIEKQINKIIINSSNIKILKEGINVSIIGKPNVGKSSLLNLLLEEEKAIVTDIEGTTRDIVEGRVIIDNLIINFIDTAGIRETNNIIEKIGVDKSFAQIEKSDLILFVLNNNEKISQEEINLYEKIKDKNHIVIINKMDLPNKLEKNIFDNDTIIDMCTKDNKGLEELKKAIKNIFNLDKIETNDITYLTNARSIAILKQCLPLIENIRVGIENNLPIDIIEIDIKEIWNKLGLIIGETYEDELINQLFSQFCLGK